MEDDEWRDYWRRWRHLLLAMLPFLAAAAAAVAGHVWELIKGKRR